MRPWSSESVAPTGGPPPAKGAPAAGAAPSAKLGAWGTTHKKQLIGGGVAAAVAAGLYRRAHPGAAAAPASSTTTTGAPRPAGSGQGYDSSSSDVYNALQPQIEQTQSLISKLIEQLKLTPPQLPPAPTPAPRPVTPPHQLPHPTPKPIHQGPHHTPPPRKKPPPAPHRPPARAYLVRKGDTLTSIARSNGLGANWQRLYAANRAAIGPNANRITAGQRLVIPR